MDNLLGIILRQIAIEGSLLRFTRRLRELPGQEAVVMDAWTTEVEASNRKAYKHMED